MQLTSCNGSWLYHVYASGIFVLLGHSSGQVLIGVGLQPLVTPALAHAIFGAAIGSTTSTSQRPRVRRSFSDVGIGASGFKPSSQGEEIA